MQGDRVRGKRATNATIDAQSLSRSGESVCDKHVCRRTKTQHNYLRGESGTRAREHTRAAELE